MIVKRTKQQSESPADWPGFLFSARR